MTAGDGAWGRMAYAFFTAMAILAFFVMRHYQPKSSTSQPPISSYHRFFLHMAAFIGGMISAKLPFLFSWSAEGTFNPVWLTDGKTVTTGLAGAYAAVELAKTLLGIRVKTGDSFAIPLAVGLAIGRLGCFVNGCCYGVPTEAAWGVDFLGDGLRHPTQLYEVAFHALMAAGLWRMARGNRLPTHRLQFYLIAYCAYRFATEFIRPEPTLAMGLTFYQGFCLCFAAALAVQWSSSPVFRGSVSPASSKS